MHSSLSTEFAPAERAGEEEVRRQSHMLAKAPLLDHVLRMVPDIVVVVNRERQIVYANESCMAFLGLKDIECVYGLRPGEAVECVHASETAGGCGTTEFCRTCGAVWAVLTSQKGERNARECRITRQGGVDALDLLVWASPFEFQNEQFSLVAVSDISHEKRRRALERIFFHDILNDAGGMQGLLEMLRAADQPEEIAEYRETLYRLSCKLVEEIKSQRALTLAENDELDVTPTQLRVPEILDDLLHTYANHPVAEGLRIALAPDAEDAIISSDEALLRRVLGNMLKNALEASECGQTVTLGCRRLMGGVEFFVHNPTHMPREVQLQIFQRSFSTKGSGRGLGTYGMRLLGEKYLGGSVYFETSRERGTTFYIRLPLTLP